MKPVTAEYHHEMNAHVAVIEPEPGSNRITVHVDAFDEASHIDELFLYNFDADGNCIEFAFGARMEHVNEKRFVVYDTIRDVHRPPFRIEISHQLDTVPLDRFRFRITWEPLPDPSPSGSAG